MATLLIHTDADGRTRRCDAKCHNARGTRCKCICDGANHGISHVEDTELAATEALHHAPHAQAPLCLRIRYARAKQLPLPFDDGDLPLFAALNQCG